jgi:hypothetical protein
MPKFTLKQVEDINTTIKKIEEKLKPNVEIGARDRTVLRALLKTNTIDKTPEFFECKREYSDAIVTHFIKEKKLTKNKFSMNAQPFIYII